MSPGRTKGVTKERLSGGGGVRGNKRAPCPKGRITRASSSEFELKVEVAVTRGSIQTCAAIGDCACIVLASFCVGVRPNMFRSYPNEKNQNKNLSFG